VIDGAPDEYIMDVGLPENWHAFGPTFTEGSAQAIRGPLSIKGPAGGTGTSASIRNSHVQVEFHAQAVP
jgi:hypothetical protein